MPFVNDKRNTWVNSLANGTIKKISFQVVKIDESGLFREDLILILTWECKTYQGYREIWKIVG